MPRYLAANTRLYRRKRAALIKRLGGKCQVTPEELKTFSSRAQKCMGSLQFDHPDGITWNLRAVASHMRIKKYDAELTAGVRLRLLCMRHNRADGWQKGKVYRVKRREEHWGTEGEE